MLLGSPPFAGVSCSGGRGRAPAANRNRGAAVAHGKYVVFTDDDCVPTARWLRAYAAAVDVGGIVYEGSTTCVARQTSARYHAPVNLSGGYLWSCNMMVRREFFLAFGGFDESYPHPHMEDTDFRERLRDAGISALFVPEATVDHPPRLTAWGARMGAMQESEVAFQAKRGINVPAVRHLARLVRYRLQVIAEYGVSRDSVSALASCVVEATYVAAMLPRWKRKHGLR